MQHFPLPGGFRLSLLLLLTSLSQASLAQEACNRACLDATLDAYLAAIVANDPAAAPLASVYRHTENDIVQPSGEGIWQTATGLGAIQRKFFDELTANAVYYGLIEEGDTLAVSGLRIHIENREITEAEWFIGRETNPGVDGVAVGTLWDADYLTNGNPPLGRRVPVAEQNSREELLYIANSYWDGIVNRNPNIAVAHPGCYREENGLGIVHSGTGPRQTPQPFLRYLLHRRWQAARPVHRDVLRRPAARGAELAAVRRKLFARGKLRRDQMTSYSRLSSRATSSIRLA